MKLKTALWISIAVILLSAAWMTCNAQQIISPFVVSPAAASGPVSIDTAEASARATDPSTVTVSTTITTANMLFAQINVERISNAAWGMDSVKWNGTSMTLYDSLAIYQDGTYDMYIFIYKLANPTSGLHDLVSYHHGSSYVTIAAVALNNVNTTTPGGTRVKAITPNDNQSVALNDIAGTAGDDLTLGFYFSQKYEKHATSPYSAGETEVAYSATAENKVGLAIGKEAASAATDMAYQVTAGCWMGGIGFAVKKAP